MRSISSTAFSGVGDKADAEGERGVKQGKCGTGEEGAHY